MQIECNTVERMVEVVYQLLQKGVKFKVHDHDSLFIIELTGGY